MAKVLRPILPARLYRFRSFDDEDTVRQEIAAIRDRYLYCARFDQMNDPMEGFFRPSRKLSGSQRFKTHVRRIVDSKSSIGIACFTERRESVLMWAHYAGNYNGICLSYSTSALSMGLPEDARIVRLTYVDDPPLIHLARATTPNIAAIRILSQKNYDWAHEREWRVLANVGQVAIGGEQSVRSIYFGSRVDRRQREAMLKTIEGTSIKAYSMHVREYEHTWKALNAAAKAGG